MGLQDGDGKTQTWFLRLYKLVCFKLTLEYCLRRLNRCTISTDGRNPQLEPLFYSSPICPSRVHTYSHGKLYIHMHTHTH